MAIGSNQLKKPTFSYKLSAEDKLFVNKYGPVVARLRRDPVFTARVLHGIIVPPHERQIWRPMWLEFRENHLVGGRGTSKSATVSSMGQVLRAETRTVRKMLSLSASKFRGGKTILEEANDFIFGRFKDQRPLGPFATSMLVHSAGVKREGDRWYIPFKTNSVFSTIPTGNHEAARGQRANWLNLDEADNWEREVVAKYFEMFLAVGTHFEDTAQGATGNAIFYTGTVSYAHKDWAVRLGDIEVMLKNRFEAQKALEAGDFETYDRMYAADDRKLENMSVSLQRWDYTDLLIPLEFDDYEVFYPFIHRDSPAVTVNPESIVQWDRRDQKYLLFTYPIDKAKIEDALDDGITDQDTWAAENRCQVIQTSGNVFQPAMLQRATSTELVTPKELEKWDWNVEDKGVYYPPLMYECDAPCVLGVDPARTADFTAFVVIRLGELEKADEPYNPNTGKGFTSWNNVIWAEAHRHLTIKDISSKIHELRKRYNVVVSAPDPSLAYGIAIDARGAAAGTVVRDELARPSPEVDETGTQNPYWVSPQVIYDPTDEEYRHLAVRGDAWPGLKILWTSDQLNTEWVGFAKAQMEQQKLYIAKYLSASSRNDREGKLAIGYIGVSSLEKQLLKIKAEPTKFAMKYYIPGDDKKLENKDDLFKAFLYAVSAARSHLALQTRTKRKSPQASAIITRPGGVSRSSNLIRMSGI